MSFELESIALAFARSLVAADSDRPCAFNSRSKVSFHPGIGPHSEEDTVRLVGGRMEHSTHSRYRGSIGYGIPYPEAPRQRCDLCIGDSNQWEWAVEIKMLRMLGDNGKANDNMLMHLLSPYSAHRSALTDCMKLVKSSLGARKAILVYGYESDAWPLEPAISAFERLASSLVRMGPRVSERFTGLIHPVHSGGEVFAWEITGPALT